MNNSSVKLKLFGGSKLKPLGEFNLPVKHKGRRHTLKFQIIEHKCKPCCQPKLGRNYKLSS